MKKLCAATILTVVFLGFSQTGLAQNISYTDEGSFLRALASQGFSAVQESFEDDSVWGAARSTIVGGFNSVRSATHLGITWTSTSDNSQITTGHGPARTGDWGFYSFPHDDYENGIGDGFAGSSTEPLVAIGGWLDTNTPPAKISIFLEGDPANGVDFGDGDFIATHSKFFGVINPGGFTRFDFREVEGTMEDAKFIFADDFTFAFGGTLTDCNGNGVSDALDISRDTSLDCNLNFIPDECEINVISSAPGGPFYCTEGCDPDCNNNGILDGCEVITTRSFVSGELSPIGSGHAQSFTITSPPTTRADVILEFSAHANLGGFSDLVAVELNGVPVGNVFGPDGSDCPEGAPDTATIVVPAATFNDATGGDDAVIDMVASREVSPDECDAPSYITARLTLFISSDLDQDENGILDSCEVGGPRFVRGDGNGDGSLDVSDPVFVLLHLFAGGSPPACEKSADTDDNGLLNLADPVAFLQFLFQEGPPPASPFHTCGLDPTRDDLGCEAFPSCP